MGIVAQHLRRCSAGAFVSAELAGRERLHLRALSLHFVDVHLSEEFGALASVHVGRRVQVFTASMVVLGFVHDDDHLLCPPEDGRKEAVLHPQNELAPLMV